MFIYKVFSKDMLLIEKGNFSGSFKDMDKFVIYLSEKFSTAYIIDFFNIFDGENPLPYEYQL